MRIPVKDEYWTLAVADLLDKFEHGSVVTGSASLTVIDGNYQCIPLIHEIVVPPLSGNSDASDSHWWLIMLRSVF